MNVDVKTIDSFLSRYLKASTFEDYGPNGLQVDAFEGEVKKIALSVSATLESIDEAARQGCEILMTHHGILWKYHPARPLTGPFGERIKRLYKNNLSLISYHLPLDAHEEVGNAVALAKRLGLKNLKPFGLHKKQYSGIQGEWDQEMTGDDVKELLQKILGRSVVHANVPEKNIRTIGIITGGANNDWIQASEAKLDAYLTGEISEYNWHDSIEAGLHFFAGGHHATEKFGIQELGERLKKEFPGLQTVFIDSANPV